MSKLIEHTNQASGPWVSRAESGVRMENADRSFPGGFLGSNPTCWVGRL